jgi:hypothetical protein
MKGSDMRLILIASLPIIALAGLGLASVTARTPPPAPQPSVRLAPAESAPYTRMAQASSKCSTSAGICFVEPLPLGSPCSCGEFSGVIIP